MIDSILREYKIGPRWKSTDLGNAGGFSGANIWKIESSVAGDFCLKQWPDGFDDSERIRWIHRIVYFAHANGCKEVVVPLRNLAGESFLNRSGSFWELSCWATGQMFDAATLNVQHIRSAIETLARFHQATARFHMNFTTSNNLQHICQRLMNLPKSLQQIPAQCTQPSVVAPEDWSLFNRAAPAIAMDIARFILTFSQSALPVQPVIRDARPEHFFFEANKTSSLIDFGAMRIDSIACDLARLFGGFFEDDAKKFCEAIEYYSAIRPLSHVEREIILPMNHANVILSIDNWMTWLFVKKIRFESMDRVDQRISQLFRRFRSLISST